MSLRRNTAQALLPFDDEAPSRPERGRSRKSNLMIVVKPPSTVSLAIHGDAQLHAGSQNSRKGAYPAHLLHMTLLCMEGFDAPPKALIDKARAVISDVQARPLAITLDSSGLFGGKQHLALFRNRGNPFVNQFSHILRRTLERHNLPSFRLVGATPHVTVIYGCGRIEALPITRNYAWIAGEFMLVYSHHGETRHEEFGRWSFDPGAPPYPSPPEQLRLKV
jgi:RNA 2',3'-cyclic 3'-phosphodiesterase